MIRLQLAILGVALFVRQCAGQASGWRDGQVNSTMCYWTSPRGAVIRDTAYLDGGQLWWQPGMADGTYGSLIGDGNPLGLVYQLNFSKSFKTSDNISDVFTTTSKAAGGGSASNLGPNYIDGGMLANDGEWFTYGGLLGITDAFTAQDADQVARYQAYSYGPPKQFSPGYALEKLPDGITRYVTDGAAVSVPSENLGFYFGGLRAESFGPIYQSPGRRNASVNADQLSQTMIELDMNGIQGSEKWSNLTLPTEAPGRASAEIVWVPVSEKGILVAIGGVVYPASANVNSTNNASTNALSEQISPGFLKTVSVYDIEKGIWYEQETSTPPPTLSQGCTVVASAQDGSSYNIYWYGGFDGIHPAGDFYDDVWILSIPSFMWMKVFSGTPSHGRAGHKCFKPYPDQMFVVGGYSSLSGTTPKCVEDGIVQIFNLSSAQWIDSYDPKVWSNYTVPDMIVSMIGGNGAGSATQTAPMPTGFANSSLTTLLGTQYNSSKIVNWYPYTPSPTGNNTRTSTLPTAVAKSGTPSYLAPVLGVVLGLFFITLVILGVLLWHKRIYLKSNPSGSHSESGTMDNKFRVTNWLRSTPVDAKAPTVTTDETPMTPFEDDPPHMPEVAGAQVYEMMDTSRLVELHDTGFIPIPGSKPIHTHQHRLHASGSVTSHTSQASTVSRESHSPRPGISPMHTHRPDSPPSPRILSGVSNISESARGHLRGISETSVSTQGGNTGSESNYATPMEMREVREVPGLGLGSLPAQVPSNTKPNVVSPLTPGEGKEESDYLAAGSVQGQGSGQGAASPTTRRKSNFAEGFDDVEK